MLEDIYVFVGFIEHLRDRWSWVTFFLLQNFIDIAVVSARNGNSCSYVEEIVKPPDFLSCFVGDLLLLPKDLDITCHPRTELSSGS